MEVSNETIDDLLEIIDSLIKENTQLKNRLELSNILKRASLYNNNSLNNYISDSYSYYTNSDGDGPKIKKVIEIRKYLGSK